MLQRLVLLFLLALLLHGCGGFYGQQQPAPVYGGRPVSKTQPDVYHAPQTKRQRSNKQDVSNSVITEPLKEPAAPESIEFKPEPLPLESEQAGQAVEPHDGQTLQQLPLTQSLEQTPRTQEPVQEAAKLTPFEPLEISASMSPAVDALVLAANQNSSSGNLEVASATIERAIRIEPRNGNLFYKLALIRLKQSKPRLAEDLAKKSALLAANDNTLKKHSWLLIAHARELQNNFKGAKEARAKADQM
jgi:hypothetical protein